MSGARFAPRPVSHAPPPLLAPRPKRRAIRSVVEPRKSLAPSREPRRWEGGRHVAGIAGAVQRSHMGTWECFVHVRGRRYASCVRNEIEVRVVKQLREAEAADGNSWQVKRGENRKGPSDGSSARTRVCWSHLHSLALLASGVKCETYFHKEREEERRNDRSGLIELQSKANSTNVAVNYDCT